MKIAVKEYQQRINEDFLPVLVNDFGRKLEVKFSGGKMKEEEITKLKMFLDMVEKSSIKHIEQELVKKLEGIKVDDKNVELKHKFENMRRMIEEGHQWIFNRLELHIRNVLSNAMYMKSIERSKNEVMLYNFVDGEVPDSVKLLFKDGMDAVQNYKMTKKEIDKRVEDALLEFLLRLGRRRIYGNRVLHTSSVQDWMRKVKALGIGQESKEFVEMLENTLPGLQAELDLVFKDVDIDSKADLLKKLEKENWVLVMCDKNMGMSLFTLETMRKADEILMKQLGAVKMENTTKEKIISDALAEINKFESKLTSKQAEYMDTKYSSRSGGINDVSFPFLKSLHKIHKMSEEQIRMKDLSILKFRPVVDAKNWVTKGYAGVVMQMMRKACDVLVKFSGPVMQELKTKDGWRFAVEMRDYTVEDEFNVVVTADIQEAYTNISDIMIKAAIKRVCRFVGYEEWKIQLMEKMVDLVLELNYAETSGGLFKFKKVLPMGYKLSGEALDIVALAEEMIVLYHLGSADEKMRFRIGELRSYPKELVENDVQTEVSMTKGVKKYKRYVDDVHSLIAGNLKEVLNGILAIGYMYPESLVVSLDLNIWQSTFLDVFSWRNVSTGEVSTLMNRKGEVPVGHVRRESCHPEKYKLQSLLGEMLRGRRIASDEELVDISDKCISHEFQSIGYSRREVLDAMEKAKQRFKEKYSGMYVKFNEDEDEGRRYFSYGGGIIFNKNYRYGEVFMNYIERIKPQGEPGIILLPDLKIKRIAFTKRRYLERQEDDKKKSKVKL